ncbi:MAG: SLATT domain-containing protein [Gammaproteobacteria bacterium]|nr:MAG: SLATT domain-containing protein [Gammaproteobacteria bacterium]
MTENTNNPKPDTARRDVQPEASHVLDWSLEHRRESIHTVYQRAEKHALDAIDWYLLSKRQKKFWAQGLRLGTIGLTALAGLLPIISEIYQFSSPAWASIALGLAGVALAIDKFCGYSSAWMRFIAAEHQIRQILHEFQMDYELEQAGWDNAQPSVEQTQAVLSRCKAFLYQVDAIIRQETDQWLAEFQDALKQIDNGTKAKTATQDTSKPA